MSQESQDFSALRQLLRLKRYEQPPPGYFHRFSAEVMARIEAGETGERAAAARFFWEAAWLQRWWSALEAKPVLAGAFGVAVCSLLIWGVVSSEKADIQPMATLVQPAPVPSNPLLAATEAISDERTQHALPAAFRLSSEIMDARGRLDGLGAVLSGGITPTVTRAAATRSVGNWP